MYAYYSTSNLILIAVCIFLRLYQLPALTDWSGDSGGDLLIARNILFFGHRPLVGPFLTVDNIFLPPLYFYILAGVLWIVGSPLGIVGFFFVMNMILGVTLGLLAGSMIDAGAGVIVFTLFAISATLVEHGRSFYQPYMMYLLSASESDGKCNEIFLVQNSKFEAALL